MFRNCPSSADVVIMFQGCFAVTSLSSFIDSGSLGYTLVSRIYCMLLIEIVFSLLLLDWIRNGSVLRRNGPGRDRRSVRDSCDRLLGVGDSEIACLLRW